MKIDGKNWANFADIYQDGFVTQFANYLKNSNNLDELLYVFNQSRYKGNLKDDVLKALKTDVGKKALYDANVIKIFNDYATKINYDKLIVNTDDILEFASSNDDWFNLIFQKQ